MSGSLASGTYGQGTSFVDGIRNLIDGLFAAVLTAPDPTHGDYMGTATQFRARVRGARLRREPSDGIESHLPDVEANPPAATSRPGEQAAP